MARDHGLFTDHNRAGGTARLRRFPGTGSGCMVACLAGEARRAGECGCTGKALQWAGQTVNARGPDVVGGHAEHDRHRHGYQRDPLSTSGNFPARASADPRAAAVSPAWSASFRSSTAPACPTRPWPSPVTVSP